MRLNKIEEKKEKEQLLKVKEDLTRKEAIEKRTKSREDMRKNKIKIIIKKNEINKLKIN